MATPLLRATASRACGGRRNQETLLAIHKKRHTCQPTRPFAAWLTAIAHYKWIERVRDASRFAALSLDDEMPVEDSGEAVISAAALDNLLGRLKPARASVIRLVKLRGLSIARASGATGQSAALVKINIHRGLKKLTALVSGRGQKSAAPGGDMTSHPTIFQYGRVPCNQTGRTYENGQLSEPVGGKKSRASGSAASRATWGRS